MVRCWDEGNKRRDCPKDLRPHKLVPRITISHLWMMSRECGWVLQVNDMMIIEEEELDEDELDEDELNEDELDEDGEFGDDDLPDDDDDLPDDEEDDDEDDVATPARPSGDDDDDEDDDDVEADLDAILKDRIAAGDDEDDDEDDDEQAVAKKPTVAPGDAEPVQARQENEFSCPHCFLLVNSTSVVDGECPHCGGLV